MCVRRVLPRRVHHRQVRATAAAITGPAHQAAETARRVAATTEAAAHRREALRQAQAVAAATAAVAVQAQVTVAAAAPVRAAATVPAAAVRVAVEEDNPQSMTII